MVYLAGSIEFSSDGGKGWRRNLRAFLQETLGHQVYDPAEDEKKNLTDYEAAHFRLWKTTDFERYRGAVRKIIDYDLDLIQRNVDCVICYWEGHTSSGGGTPTELTMAYRKGIPVYLVTELPFEEISGWVLSCAERVFSSFDELKAFLVASRKDNRATGSKLAKAATTETQG